MPININEIKKGSELRELRKSLNMSQEKFAGTIGYTMNRISVIERTNATLPPKVERALHTHIKPKR